MLSLVLLLKSCHTSYSFYYWLNNLIFLKIKLDCSHSNYFFLLGIYLCRYADLLQANPLEAGAVGDVVIFKIMKVILTCICT
jgi:hypothetical protein